jgi:hypothetical protein
MNLRVTKRHRSIATVAAIVLSLIALRVPAAQSILMDKFIEFAQVTERAVRFPYWLVTHAHCFSLDRFDPTCPQCM